MRGRTDNKIVNPLSLTIAFVTLQQNNVDSDFNITMHRWNTTKVCSVGVSKVE